MKRFRFLVVTALVLAAVMVLQFAPVRGWLAASPAPAAGASAGESPDLSAGPGLVEAISEEIRVGGQVGGRLSSVRVDEGDRVAAGDVLAVIENHDYRARVAAAEAELLLREAEHRRLVNGARVQERQEVAATVAEANAVLQHALTEQARQHTLSAQGIAPRAAADDADRSARVAGARVDVARERLALINAEPREEDRARAEADVRLARAHLDEARAQYDKTFIRAPIAGVILRRLRQPGESVSTLFDSPVVTLANDRVRRVRVDVDETEVAHVAIGQTVYVTADAFGDRRFPGRVVRVGQSLGRKNVRTDTPNEKVDTKILETLVELDDGRELPLGLRVQAFISRR
jgi:HlyD family secretion protein